MIIVNHYRVAMSQPTIKMGVILWQVIMAMCKRCILLVWPKKHATHKPCACHQCKDDKRGHWAERRHQPPR